MKIYISKKANIKFNIPVYEGRVRNFLFTAIIALSALALVLGGVCLYLESQFTRCSIEAGEQITPSDITGDSDARFGDGFSYEWLNKAGIYRFTVHSRGKEIDVRLRVRDTKAPDVTVKKNVYFAIGGPMPEPEDFIESVYEADDFTGEFLTEMPKLTSVGEYKMQIRFTDASGNSTPVFNVKMTPIYDNKPPEMDIPDTIVAYVGEAIAYRKYIELTDNCIGELTFEVDESGLDLSSEGEYRVYITASDAVGNKTKKQAVTVKVIPTSVEREELFEKMEKLVRKIIRNDMSREQQCRAIYDYVTKNIAYTGESRKGDYISEAYRALFVSAEGDCYTYFAVSKAFFEYLGIENMDVRRAEGYTADTHYWNLVNIGDESGARWYHFDATRLIEDENSHSGCLLTDVQIEAYSRARANFYRYDKLNYPAVEEEIITPTPNLEKYYPEG